MRPGCTLHEERGTGSKGVREFNQSWPGHGMVELCGAHSSYSMILQHTVNLLRTDSLVLWS